MAAGHRPDIEGLRGVAVLAVLAVHAWPDVLRGGFVGVDIFFVLSGFLITSLIFDAMEKGQFSIGTFYRRRVLRLFPALCTVLLCCLIASTFAFPSETQQIGKHIAASSVFASNIALWQEAGYFDASSDSKPLLHLWSLGIEEQFYLLWPLAAVLMFRWRQHASMIVLLAVVLSFVLNVFWVIPKAKGTFFLLPTRAWELLIGSLLVCLQRYGSGVPLLTAAAHRVSTTWVGRHLAGLSAWSGVVLIALAFTLLDAQSAFPGWWALLPTCGTALLLAAGSASWFNRRVLSHRVMVFYGSISYPLYLWHWPLLVFPALLGFDLDNAARVLILTASVALAALTMEFIERPIRFGDRWPQAPWALVGAMATLGAAGVVLHLTHGLVDSYPMTVREIARADVALEDNGYRPGRCFLDLEQGPHNFAEECGSAVKADRVTLLWGDSHAAALYPGLVDAVASDTSGLTLAQFTKARCPPVENLPALASRGCKETHQYVLRTIERTVPDTVILGGFWSLYATDAEEALSLKMGLRKTVETLTALGVKHVVVIGHQPTWSLPLPRLLLREWNAAGSVSERSVTGLDQRAPQLDRELERALAGTRAVFVSPHAHMCNSDGCLTSQMRDGRVWPLASDQSHLTVLGSVAFVQRSRNALFH